MKVMLTGSLPQCPHCKKPTERTEGESTTIEYTITIEYYCLGCKKGFKTIGNYADGFEYLI